MLKSPHCSGAERSALNHARQILERSPSGGGPDEDPKGQGLVEVTPTPLYIVIVIRRSYIHPAPYILASSICSDRLASDINLQISSDVRQQAITSSSWLSDGYTIPTEILTSWSDCSSPAREVVSLDPTCFLSWGIQFFPLSLCLLHPFCPLCPFVLSRVHNPVGLGCNMRTTESHDWVPKQQARCHFDRFSPKCPLVLVSPDQQYVKLISRSDSLPSQRRHNPTAPSQYPST